MSFETYLFIITPVLLLLIALALFLLWVNVKQSKQLDEGFDAALKESVKGSGFIIDRKIGRLILISKATKQLMYWNNNKVNIVGFDEIDHIEPCVSSGTGAYSNKVDAYLTIYVKSKSGEPKEISCTSFNSPKSLFEHIQYLTLITGKALLKEECLEKEDKLTNKFNGVVSRLSKRLANIGPDFN